MIRVELNQYELSRLLEFADKDMKSSHMDSEEFIIPEYRILRNKISNATCFIELNNTEAEILSGWIHDGITYSIIKKVEDKLLTTKIYDAIYAEYSTNKTDYYFHTLKLQESLNNIARLAGKDEIRNGETVLPEPKSIAEVSGQDLVKDPFLNECSKPSDPTGQNNEHPDGKNTFYLTEKIKLKMINRKLK